MRKGPSTSRLYLLALSGILLLPSLSAGLVPLDEDNRKAGLTAFVAGGFGSEELEVQPSLEAEPRPDRRVLRAGPLGDGSIALRPGQDATDNRSQHGR